MISTIKKKVYFSFLLVLMIIAACEKEVSVSPPDKAPPNGSIILSSYPNDFDIYLNGKDRVRKTPDSLNWLSTGTYEIILKKELYADTVFNVEVIEGEKKTVFINFSTNPKMLGTLYIDSHPQGASIFFSDSNTSHVTPFTFNNLLPGNYFVALKKNGFADFQTILTLKSSQISQLKKTIVDTTIWESYNTNNTELPTNKFTCVIISDNIKWFGSNKGVFRYDDLSWRQFSTENSILSHTNVNAIMLGEDDEKWICTNEGVSVIENDAVIISYNFVNSSLRPGKVFAASFIKGEVRADTFYTWPKYYFASEGLISLRFFNLDKIKWEWENYLPVYLGTKITALAVDGPFLLIGSENSGFVAQFYNDGLLYTRSNSIIPSNSISSIVKGREGFWLTHKPIGGYSGITYFSKGEFTCHRFLEYPIPSPNTIFIDKNSNKWLGADIGLYYFKDFDDIKFFNEENTGIPLKNITGIGEDDQDNIWITTADNGIFKLKNISSLIQSVSSY